MHVASAEIDEDKQRFLVDTSLEPGGITQLFANIHDLAKDEAPNLASTGWALGGDERNLPDPTPVNMLDILFFIVGFSCTSASQLNADKARAADCLWDLRTTTGDTFYATLTVLWLSAQLAPVNRAQ